MGSKSRTRLNDNTFTFFHFLRRFLLHLIKGHHIPQEINFLLNLVKVHEDPYNPLLALDV